MGIRYQYNCKKCGYNIVTSGGADTGFILLTDTFKCNECRIIFDAKVGDRRQRDKDASWVKGLNKKISLETLINHHEDIKLPVKCSKCDGSNTKLWDGYCPKCGAEMTRGRLVMVWD